MKERDVARWRNVAGWWQLYEREREQRDKWLATKLWSTWMWKEENDVYVKGGNIMKRNIEVCGGERTNQTGPRCHVTYKSKNIRT